ncbi:MAG: hypothetical protein U0804_01185 [Gemmataceae bacterium]
MWQRMRRVVLKAAFAERADLDHAWTAAWTAGERTAAKLAPETEGEMRLEVELDAAREAYDAIRRYQLLRAGPPAPPQPVRDRKTPRRPIRVLARTTLARLINRFRMAARVLVLGHRPATVRFDALDRRIAENCAFGAADIIAARYAPTELTMEENDDVCRKVAWLVYDAIEGYVTYSVEFERDCKKALASAEARRELEGTKDPDIPF